MKQIRFITEIAYNMQQVMKAKESFEQANPDVRIVVEQSKDYFEMMQAYKSEDAPDIIETGGLQIGNPDGIFIDLNPYVAETEGLEEDLYAGLMRVARNGGMLPGLPIEVSAPLILYNKEMFDRAGLAYPTDDWSWDDMVELAGRLTIRSEQGVAKQFGFGIGVDIEWFEPFVMRNGGRYVAPDGSTSRGYVDSPATIEAFRKLIDAFRVHRIIRKPDEPCEAGAWHEESAMTFSFAWNAGQLFHHKLGDRYGVVGLPNMPGGAKANMVYMGGAGVTTKSAHPRIAWEFLRHYIVECHSWSPPISKSQAEQRRLTVHPIWSRYLEELDHVQISGYYLNKKWNASRQLINDDIRKMIVEGADVAQTLRSWTRYT
ncbi:extracellular solute-binding protein [Paenibacillus mesophilus]|uniref:ABC transporter substrate-binding protein n=1 Tax=Paenibacillus mesophilus TaxID=2582849 RepID=UPI00110E975D|nr:extracellular solute-binding protein [Paenibacillus mesophilus]TMV45978.1 extracellular solute-binding protein [Paenibacillus mesophilus]